MTDEHRIGQAGEHLVCADLILKGYRSCLADHGSPFDVIAESGGKLIRVQVKTTDGPSLFPKSGLVFRFGLRHGKGGNNRSIQADVYAFVVLASAPAIGSDIAYVDAADLTSNQGRLICTVEFAVNPYVATWNGAIHRKTMAEFAAFPPQRRPQLVPDCHPNRPYFARGRCRQCYQRDRYLEGPGKGRKRREV